MNIQIGFAGLLTLIFVAAKLFGAIAWSWLWVLSPLWIGFAIGLVLVVLAIVIAALTELAK